jgi:hypothetical protein
MEEISNDSGAVSVVRGWPGMSDYVIASSTIEEFVAFRSTVDGSFYIRHVCKVGKRCKLNCICRSCKTAVIRTTWPMC